MFKIAVTLFSALAVASLTAAQRSLTQPPGLDAFGASRLFPGAGGLLPRTSGVVDPVSASAVTVNKFSENNGDGNFRYGFETTNGIKAEETGVLKGPDPENPEGSQAVQGSYSYISPEGIPITVNYVADENGFRAVGDHIPTNNVHGANFDTTFDRQVRPVAGLDGLGLGLNPQQQLLRNPLNPAYAYNGLRGLPNVNRLNPYYPQNHHLGRFGVNPYHAQPLLAGQRPLLPGQQPYAGFPYNRGIGAGLGLGLGGALAGGFPNRYLL